MSRLGPEDGLVAVQTRTNSSPYVTAGNDWAIEQHAKDTSGFYYKDTEEAVRLAAIVESNRCVELTTAQRPHFVTAAALLRRCRGLPSFGDSFMTPCGSQLSVQSPRPFPFCSQENRILRDLAKSRYLCAQSSFALDVRGASLLKKQRSCRGPAVCVKPTQPHVLPHSRAPQMCNRSYRLQQRKHCTPTILERMKCGVKLCVAWRAKQLRRCLQCAHLPPPLYQCPRRRHLVSAPVWRSRNVPARCRWRCVQVPP